MFELIKNEFKRYRKWLLITAILNVFFLGLGIYLDDFERSGISVGVAFTLLYGINAMLLGASQMKTYRPVNMWTYLINRPVQPSRLCMGLVTAAILVLTCSMTLPYLLLTFLVDLSGLYIIDNRHYLQALYITLMIISMYLTAAMITLSNNKISYAVWLFPILILNTLINGGPIIMVVLISLLWQIFLLISIFKANLNSPDQNKPFAIGIALPFHLAAFWILSVSVAFFSQVYLMVVDGAGISIAWNYYFSDNTYDYSSYQEPTDRMILGLSDDPGKNSLYLQRQLKNSDASIIMPQIIQRTEHQQLPYLQNFDQINIHDSINDTNWTFSHDQMTFIKKPGFAGRGHIYDQPRLKLKGQEAGYSFKLVPVVIGSQIITPHALYQYDPYLQQIELKMTTTANETLLTSLELNGHHYTALTTSALYLFDPLQVKNQPGNIDPIIRIPLPGNYENLTSIEFSSLIDSHVISFLYGKLSDKGQHKALQITQQLNSDYQPIHTTTRPLLQGFSELYRQRGFYLSPLLNVIDQSLVTPMISAPNPQAIQSWFWPQLSKQLVIVMLICSLICTTSAYVYLRNRSRSIPILMLQLLITALTSFTGLLFCYLFYQNNKTEIQANK